MKKVYVHPPGEGWIIDRFVDEWNNDNADISTTDPSKADVIWLLADFAWNQVPKSALYGKRVITSIHHIVDAKFGPRERYEFQLRDNVTTAYHVYNEQTRDFVSKLTSKPIYYIKYWANQRIWRPTDGREAIKKRFSLPETGYLIGSFQRDTEGHDLASPKLEKGPDILADLIIQLNASDELSGEVFVVLGGWRRQYLMKRLRMANIPFAFFERPDQRTINDLYQVLDLYPVTSRCEGGPQSLIECGLLNVPVVSTPMGIAKQVLPSSAISREFTARSLMETSPSIPNVVDMLLPAGYDPYRKMLLG